MEKNASEFAAQQEWEAEWNQLGLASRLSEEVFTSSSLHKIIKIRVFQRYSVSE
jgi:hypothetical protein